MTRFHAFENLKNRKTPAWLYGRFSSWKVYFSSRIRKGFPLTNSGVPYSRASRRTCWPEFNKKLWGSLLMNSAKNFFEISENIMKFTSQNSLFWTLNKILVARRRSERSTAFLSKACHSLHISHFFMKNAWVLRPWSYFRDAPLLSVQDPWSKEPEVTEFRLNFQPLNKIFKGKTLKYFGKFTKFTLISLWNNGFQVRIRPHCLVFESYEEAN